MTQYVDPKTEAPILLPIFDYVTDLRTRKWEQGVRYIAILEVLHAGKEALLPRWFCVDNMLISEFSVLITLRYPKTYKGLWITYDLST